MSTQCLYTHAHQKMLKYLHKAASFQTDDSNRSTIIIIFFFKRQIVQRFFSIVKSVDDIFVFVLKFPSMICEPERKKKSLNTQIVGLRTSSSRNIQIDKKKRSENAERKVSISPSQSEPKCVRADEDS